MFSAGPITLACDANLDAAIAQTPASAGVFAIWPREGEPYLGRTGNLRRRLARLLRAREQPGRLLYLRGISERIEYWPAASRLESSLVLYEAAKQYLPSRYTEFLKLRMPPYVRLTLNRTFPGTQVTTRPAAGVVYGPFRSRAAAELFEHSVLDLFQLRRCQEDFDPAPDHPGCIYGEMNMCLRPCQTCVSVEEYASEAARVADFLRTDGRKAQHNAAIARDRLSAELDFEAAARQHKRVEQIDELLRLREHLACDVERLCGVAVQPSILPGTVSLWFLISGTWQPLLTFSVSPNESAPMDRRLREAAASLAPVRVPASDRAEHLAILARWYYSSWRDGFWIGGESIDRISYRRLVSAISKTVHEQTAAASDSAEQM